MRSAVKTVQFVTSVLLLNLASACSQQPLTAPDELDTPSTLTHSRLDPKLIVAFENKIVETLLATEKQTPAERNSVGETLLEQDDLETRIQILEQRSKRLAEVNHQVLNAENKQAIRLHHRLLARLKRKLVSQRLTSTNQLGARYPGLVAHYSTLELPPDSLLSKASERLADNRSEIERLLQRADIQVAINRLLATLSNDQALFLSDSNEDKHLYLNLISDLVSAAPSTFADYILNVENKPIEVRASFDQGSTPAQFAYHPAQQSSAPTAVLKVNLNDMSKLPLYEAEAKSFIYGIPGMHQLSSARTIGEDDSVFSVDDLPAFTIGWGLYTAKLARDYDLYRSPYGKLGSLMLESRYAARLIVDIKLNQNLLSDEQALVFLKEQGFETAESAHLAISTSRQSPGKQTSAISGLLAFMSLRSRSETKLGDRFNARQFHQQILSRSPLPLWLLEEELNEWLIEHP
ncbi:DUF885 domain-containing protein [Pseudomonadales bacterium]|nr:DUF885 domain-containing protein [Pseudomonadales bacterium]